jgi:hypothetical protein
MKLKDRQVLRMVILARVQEEKEVKLVVSFGDTKIYKVMSSFLKQGVRRTKLNKKKLGKILEPNHNGRNFSLIAVGRDNGISLDEVFDFFGVFIAETFTDSNNWESFSEQDSTMFKNKDTNTEAMLMPIGHNHNEEVSIWDVRIDAGMRNLFIDYIEEKKLSLTKSKNI